MPCAGRRLGAARRGGPRIRARRRHRRARARRAARASASNWDPELRARRARHGVDRRGVRDRARRRDHVRAVARRARPGRALPRPCVQPGAPRRELPLRPLVRRSPGAASRSCADTRRSRATSTWPHCSRRRSPCCSPSPNVRSRITCASSDVRVSRVEGRLELRDGSQAELDAESLIAAEERGLRLLAATSVVLAAALVAFRI